MKYSYIALSECCEFLDHIRKPVKESERISGPYPYYGANGQQGWIDNYLFDEPLVLLAEDGGHFLTPERGIAYKIEGKSWVNNHAHVLRPKEDLLHVEYLEYALRNKDVRKYLSGSTRHKLTKTGASQIEIPLPPLEEQRRIAAILDKASKLSEASQRRKDLLKACPLSIFIEIFGDPRHNPKQWPIIRLGEICINEDARRVPVKSANRKAMQGRYPYYGASGIIDHVDDYLFDGKRLLIGEDGANLLARSSPIAFIADGKYWVNNHAHVLNENGKAKLRFLEYYFALIDLKPFVTGSAQPKLTRSALDSLPVPLPPIELQERFVSFLNILDSKHARAEISGQTISSIKRALQHLAFEGDVHR
ncbi:restriction endonuclease subunit S [Synechococcus sp. UW140]|uniref:restriction endonuclease subunit S n=1 Tax=Synechococcus sp. UW140 TaxID=368503 RepID=UPI000E0F69E8|nr:restriction endonuclease subunit S [Synechococcus sp. UW140]